MPPKRQAPPAASRRPAATKKAKSVEKAEEKEVVLEAESGAGGKGGAATVEEIYLGIDSSDDDGDASSSDSASDSEHNDAFAEPHGAIALDKEHEEKLYERLKTISAKPDTAIASKSNKNGIIYLGRIPHGFHEEQMQDYFAQFGRVLQLRLSRNPKTGKSRHYAFIQFADAEVAAIVAETMNNYLLYNHLLKCKVVPEEKVHDDMWRGAGSKFRLVPHAAIARKTHNRVRTEEEVKSQITRLVKNENKRRKKLKSAGIDYEYPGYDKLVPAGTLALASKSE